MLELLKNLKDKVKAVASKVVDFVKEHALVIVISLALVAIIVGGLLSVSS